MFAFSVLLFYYKVFTTCGSPISLATKARYIVSSLPAQLEEARDNIIWCPRDPLMTSVYRLRRWWRHMPPNERRQLLTRANRNKVFPRMRLSLCDDVTTPDASSSSLFRSRVRISHVTLWWRHSLNDRCLLAWSLCVTTSLTHLSALWRQFWTFRPLPRVWVGGGLVWFWC